MGGDDFVLLCRGESVDQLCQVAIDAFAAASPALYSAEDRERGYVEGQGRDGRVGRFELLTVSMKCFFWKTAPTGPIPSIRCWAIR